ncbi:MAG TPA: hypothetical protein VK466_02310 [Terriglobales bacterium]|nr:hypothetical protein [Terriglobales bacterium]
MDASRALRVPRPSFAQVMPGTGEPHPEGGEIFVPDMDLPLRELRNGTTDVIL